MSISEFSSAARLIPQSTVDNSTILAAGNDWNRWQGELENKDVCVIDSNVYGNCSVEFNERFTQPSLGEVFGEGLYEFALRVPSVVSRIVSGTKWFFHSIWSSNPSSSTEAVSENSSEESPLPQPVKVRVVTDEERDSVCKDLFQCVFDRDQEKMQAIVKTNPGFDLNACERKGETLLTRAIMNNSPDMVKLLLQSGADINKPNSNKRTPIWIAMYYAGRDIHENLKEFGGEILDPCEDLFLCLHLNDQERMRAIMKKNPGFVLDKCQMRDETLMTRAVRHDLSDMVKVLHELGSDVNQDLKGWTPATLAVYLHHVRVFKQLAESGADLDKADGKLLTPLSLAFDKNHEDIIRVLHDFHANLSALDARSRTLFYKAVLLHKDTLVRLLLSYGLDANAIVNVDNDLISPLALALLQQQKNVIAASESFGVNFEEAQSLAQLRRVSLVWGLSGSVFYRDIHGTPYEGFIEGAAQAQSLPLLSKFVEGFLEKEEETGLIPSEKARIREAVENAYERGVEIGTSIEPLSDRALVERIKSKKTTVFFLPMVQRGVPGTGHQVGLVFSNQKTFVCNRGDAIGPNIKIFSYEDDYVTDRLMSKLKDIVHKDEFDNLLQSPFLHLEGGIDRKPQKVGNCVFVTAKAVFQALVYTATEDRIADPVARSAYSKEEYKKFATSCGIQSLEEYLTSRPSHKVLVKIQTKLIGSDDYLPFEKKREILQKVDDAISRTSDDYKQVVASKHKQEVDQFEQFLRSDNRAAIHDSFFQAVRSNNLSLVKRLIETVPGIDLNALNSGATSFMRAVLDDNYDMALLLKEHGANVNEVDVDGLTTASTAVIHNSGAQVRFLKEKCKVDLNEADHLGSTPLVWALKEKNLKMARFLCELDVDVNKPASGKTPLVLAVDNQNLEIVRLLITARADLDAISPDRWTALTSAIYWKNVEIIKLLVDSGADINKPDNNRVTPLVLAVRTKSLDIVRLVLSSGADLEPFHFGCPTALTLAAEQGSSQIVTFLMDQGADIDRPDGCGHSARTLFSESQNSILRELAHDRNTTLSYQLERNPR